MSVWHFSALVTIVSMATERGIETKGERGQAKRKRGRERGEGGYRKKGE